MNFSVPQVKVFKRRYHEFTIRGEEYWSNFSRGAVFIVRWHITYHPGGRPQERASVLETEVVRFLYAIPRRRNWFGLPVEFSLYFEAIEVEMLDGKPFLRSSPMGYTFSTADPPDDVEFLAYVRDEVLQGERIASERQVAIRALTLMKNPLVRYATATCKVS